MSMDLNVKNTDLLTVGEMEFIQELSEYKFPNRVYQTYRHTTNGNFDISYQDAKKKLIRNIVLGAEAPMIEGMQHKRVFCYCNLMIHLNIREKSICYIQNVRSRISEDKKDILNEIMGIKSI